MTTSKKTNKQPIAIEDLYEFRIPSQLELSGDVLVWVESRIDRSSTTKKESTETGPSPRSRLLICRDGGPAQELTEHGANVDSNPAISPDRRWVAFLRKDESKKSGPTQLCTIALDGGSQPKVLASARGDFSRPVWAPDSSGLVVSFRHADPLPPGRSAPLSIRVNRGSYKMDGYGYLPQDRSRLYWIASDRGSDDAADMLQPLELGQAKGDGRWDDSDPIFSPDGAQLAFLSSRGKSADLNPENRDLFVVGFRAGDASLPPTVCTWKEGGLMEPVWAPSGEWIAAIGYIGPPGSMLMRKQVGLISIDPSGEREEVNLTEAVDASLMNLTIDDLWGLDAWVQKPVFCDGGEGKGTRVLVPIPESGTTSVVSFAVDSAGSEAVGPDRLVDDAIVVAFTGDGQTSSSSAANLALLTTSADRPGIISMFNIASGKRSKVAAPLEAYTDQRTLAQPIRFEETTPDGQAIEAWMYLPEGQGPHPMLLNIHGGPVVQYGTGFFHEVQTFVAAGYAVLMANPRGSQGYGIEFCTHVASDWGRKPFIDLMAVTDGALRRFTVDESRMGVMGGSYGGYMTNWILGHTDRFKSACSQRTVSAVGGLLWSDGGCAWGQEFGAWEWEDPERYRDQSPITYAANFKTPLLILQGDNDMRTPSDQGERLYITLRVLGKPVEMVIFPGANHDLSRGGAPEQRVERLRVIHEWFARTL